jgi:hypothetical protein
MAIPTGPFINPDVTSMPNQTESSHDFDFQIGTWNVKHRRLTERLVNSDNWEAFDGTCAMSTMLGGNGNIEDNVLHISTGTYRAIALRSFDPTNQAWAIWWLDSRNPHMLDVPVIGRFQDGVGTFYATDKLNQTPVRVRFKWMRTDTPSPRWEQAMSADDGKTWETNWTMDFEHQ